jgi:hypothetical protein
VLDYYYFQYFDKQLFSSNTGGLESHPLDNSIIEQLNISKNIENNSNLTQDEQQLLFGQMLIAD